MVRSLHPWAVVLGIVIVAAPGSRAADPKAVDLKVGDAAPAFAGTDDQGKPWKSADHIGKKVVVVYFYPADLTGGCTKQACGFRDAYETFLAAGADVIGISSGTPEVRNEFITEHRIPFKLLYDHAGAARDAFGVGKFLGLDMRITFVIDRSGLVRHVTDTQLRVGRHIVEAMAMVTELA